MRTIDSYTMLYRHKDGSYMATDTLEEGSCQWFSMCAGDAFLRSRGWTMAKIYATEGIISLSPTLETT